jgi:hypothetical protein
LSLVGLQRVFISKVVSEIPLQIVGFSKTSGV